MELIFLFFVFFLTFFYGIFGFLFEKTDFVEIEKLEENIMIDDIDCKDYT